MVDLIASNKEQEFKRKERRKRKAIQGTSGNTTAALQALSVNVNILYLKEGDCRPIVL